MIDLLLNNELHEVSHQRMVINQQKWRIANAYRGLVNHLADGKVLAGLFVGGFIADTVRCRQPAKAKESDGGHDSGLLIHSISLFSPLLWDWAQQWWEDRQYSSGYQSPEPPVAESQAFDDNG